MDKKASPFEFRIEGDNIIRCVAETNEERGSISKDDTEALCNLIAALDEDLWQTRLALGASVDRLVGRLDKIAELAKR